MIEQGLERAVKRQTEPFAGDGIGAAIDAHAVGSPKDKRGHGRFIRLDLDVHAVAPAGLILLPSGLNSMFGGTFTLGLGCAGFMGEAASRPKT